MPVDYTKWKDIEVSDDEDDTHPNVDTPSLFRWRHQARLERMAEHKRAKEEVELRKNDFSAKLEHISKQLADTTIVEEKRAKLVIEKSEMAKQHEQWLAKEAELAKEEDLEKWNVDTISHETWSETRIAKPAAKKPERSEEEETKLMREFFDKHEKEMLEFGKLSTWNESEHFLTGHTYLCNEWTANYLTLEALNAGIRQKEARLTKMAGQIVTLQYLLELAKSLKANPESPSLINGFFRKINAAEETYMQMYYDEVQAFILRIHKRSAVKREEAMQEAEEEEKQARIKASPGGLDPIQVLNDSPKEMREAFESQDISRLQAVSASMDQTVFKATLDLWIKSGLWVPGPNDDQP